MTPLLILLGLVAIVLMISALASGLVDRSPLSFPLIFLGLGLVFGLTGFVEIQANSPLLEGVSAITLSLALFLDATKLRFDELRRDWLVPLLTLGPGTVLTIAGMSAGAYVLLGIQPLEALLVGAALASTDPIVLREVLRDPRIPRSIRRVLNVEAGMNDIVVLPIVLVVIALLAGRIGSSSDLLLFVAQILLLSPLIGLAIGISGGWLMGKADERYAIRREYQALYGIGLVLAAYAAGQMVGGSGFVAAFFAGLGITLLPTSLCDCFMEYGETTSEMLMLLAFVLFGVVLSSLLPTINLVAGLALAVFGIFVVRPLAMWLSLLRARVSSSARVFIGWFGPRGLSSLLLVLLAITLQIPNSESLLGVVGAVVVVSVILHGVTATPGATWYANKVAAQTLAEERESTFAALFARADSPIRHVNANELSAMLSGDNPPVVLDVRSRSAYAVSTHRIPGDTRITPDMVEEWAVDKPKDRPVYAYCTCPDEATSLRVAAELTLLGFIAGVLDGGFESWVNAGLPTVKKA
jgi:NhaP-type Na+/H+ or K+/H+ antiporter